MLNKFGSLIVALASIVVIACNDGGGNNTNRPGVGDATNQQQMTNYMQAASTPGDAKGTALSGVYEMETTRFQVENQKACDELFRAAANESGLKEAGAFLAEVIKELQEDAAGLDAMLEIRQQDGKGRSKIAIEEFLEDPVSMATSIAASGAIIAAHQDTGKDGWSVVAFNGTIKDANIEGVTILHAAGKIGEKAYQCKMLISMQGKKQAAVQQ